MPDNSIKTLRKRYWLQAWGWVFLIYLTIPIVKPICELLKKVTAFSALVNIFLLCFLAVVLLIFSKQTKIKRVSSCFLIFALSATYAYLLFTLKIPEERIHLVQYGFLSFLIHRALRLDLKSHYSYLAAFALTGIFGMLDEVIQYFIPNRYCQLSDMVLNLFSGGLGLLTTFAVRGNTNRREKTRNL